MEAICELKEYPLPILFEDEIQRLETELERIKDKYGSNNNGLYEFRIVRGKKNSSGGRPVKIQTTETMMGTFVAEEIT